MKINKNLFFLFINRFLYSSVSQRIIDPIHGYPTVSYFYRAEGDYFIFRTSTEWNVWNLTSHQPLMTFPARDRGSLNFGESVFVYQKTLYIAYHNTNQIAVVNLLNGTIIETFQIDSCALPTTGGPYYVSSEHIIVPCDDDIKVIVILDKNNYKEIKRFNLFVLNKGILLDADAVYMTYLDKTGFQKLLKKTFDENIAWEITLEESQNIYGVALNINKYFLFASVQNYILQIDKQQGVVIRKIPTSGWTVRAITSTEKYLFLLFYDGNTLQLTMEMNFVAYYRSNGKTVAVSAILFSKNNIFSIEPQILVANNCPKTLKLLQFKVSEIVETAVFSLSKGIPAPISPKLSIDNNDGPSPIRFNTATYIKQFKRIQKALPQNSFFTPIMINGVNGSWNYIYFSGAGNVKTGLCGDNRVHRFRIPSFQSLDESHQTNEIFSFNETNIYSYYKVDCGIPPDVDVEQDMARISSIYDYAAVLLSSDEYYYYIIHGGCSCYLPKTKYEVVVIQIDLDFNFQHFPIYQSKYINRYL